jgi:hypothetical protein
LAGIDILPFASRVIADAPWNTIYLLWPLISFICCGVKPAKKSHKTTLFHTVAHFRVRKHTGQALSGSGKSEFINEIKDLASIVEKCSD